VPLARCPLEAALEPFLQVPHLPRYLPLRLPADDEGHKQLAEPVPLEVELDRHARSSPVTEGLDGAVYDPPDRTIDTATAQLLGGSILVISIVIVRSPRPILRVVTAFERMAGGAPAFRA
jgi:hypothetical protein